MICSSSRAWFRHGTNSASSTAFTSKSQSPCQATIGSEGSGPVCGLWAISAGLAMERLPMACGHTLTRSVILERFLIRLGSMVPVRSRPLRLDQTMAHCPCTSRDLARALTISLPGQRLSACTCKGEDHPGPDVSVGRGSPEIDIIEVCGSDS